MPQDCIVPSFLTSRSQVLTRKGLANFTYDAWDVSIYGPKIVVDPDGTWRMFYTGYANAYASWRICVVTSTDQGNTWTKPRLGLYTFNGSTANNICLQAVSENLQFLDAKIDPTTGLYLISVRNDTTTSNQVYTSINGESLTFVSVAFTNGTHLAHIEGKAISWNQTDGKYRYWYNEGHFLPSPADSRRSIGYYDCATLNGTWVNRGLISTFTSVATTLQYYDFSPFYYEGSMWAAINVFNKTTELLAPARLYRSDDNGNTWVRSTDLLRQSPAGQWDTGLITDACPLLFEGVWYYFYGGKTGDHNSTVKISLGLATAYEDAGVAASLMLLDRLTIGGSR